MRLDQDGNGVALYIDAESTSANVIDIDSPTTADGIIFDVDADALTTGSILNLTSASIMAGTRNLVYILNDTASATGATCLSVKQDSTGNAAFIDHNGLTAGYALEIDRDSNHTATVYAMKIDSDNAGSGVGGGIDFSSMGAAEPVMKVYNDTTSAAAATSVGRFAVETSAGVKYARLYDS